MVVLEPRVYLSPTFTTLAVLNRPERRVPTSLHFLLLWKPLIGVIISGGDHGRAECAGLRAIVLYEYCNKVNLRFMKYGS